jgi:hypothetical protein
MRSATISNEGYLSWGGPLSQLGIHYNPKAGTREDNLKDV